ncbi:Protein TIFY 10A [Platanthera zijinensis]|uniref:Protein TIFY n=1 Tax=Platanthera zijinensis TaxID=2320716 RepID=A0AAP0G770_9ASPA
MVGMTNGVETAKRPEKSSFSVTCSLLSQFIKEKGSLAELGLGLPPRSLDCPPLGKLETNRPTTTMNLISGVDMKEETRSMELFPSNFTGLEPAEDNTKAAEKSQLTIFYAGKVMVFDNFPSEKARDLMQLASRGQNTASGEVAPAPAVPVANTPSCPATAKPPANFPPRAQPNFSDLPIARKASLHRFLEKRKDRISAKTPYQLSSSNGTKDSVVVKEEEISQPWLGLGPQLSTMRLNSNCTR